MSAGPAPGPPVQPGDIQGVTQEMLGRGVEYYCPALSGLRGSNTSYTLSCVSGTDSGHGYRDSGKLYLAASGPGVQQGGGMGGCIPLIHVNPSYKQPSSKLDYENSLSEVLSERRGRPLL